MKPCRVHITGASGCGVTTLGRALAQAWSVPCHDSDDYYWLPTDPPFRIKRTVSKRLELMRRVFLPRRAWVLTGSLMGWGNHLAADFDLVIFLRLDAKTRMERLRAREATRYDSADLKPGGELHTAHLAFMAWAARYDDPAFTGRSLARHEAWLEGLPCPHMTLDSSAPVADLLAAVVDG